MSLRETLHGLYHDGEQSRAYLLRSEAQDTVTSHPLPSQTNLKEHAVVAHAEDDDLLDRYRKAATRHAERTTGHLIDERTWVFEWDGFEPELRLPVRPVQSLDSITKIEDGTETSIDTSNFTLTDGVPHIVRRHDSVSSPTYPLDRFRITCTVGYAKSANVPEDYRQALRQMVTDLYEGRTDFALDDEPSDLPMTWKALLRPLAVPSRL